jgi:hypothetical protein
VPLARSHPLPHRLHPPSTLLNRWLALLSGNSHQYPRLHLNLAMNQT